MTDILLIFLLIGYCGSRHIDRELDTKCSKHGVEYVESDFGLALSIDAEGKPVKCEKK